MGHAHAKLHVPQRQAAGDVSCVRNTLKSHAAVGVACCCCMYEFIIVVSETRVINGLTSIHPIGKIGHQLVTL